MGLRKAIGEVMVRKRTEMPIQEKEVEKDEEGRRRNEFAHKRNIGCVETTENSE